MTTEKTVYETPAMTSLGSFETLTQGGTGRTQLDANFPVGTPFGDLTFS